MVWNLIWLESPYLLEHDKLVLCIIPLVDFDLIPERADKYQVTIGS